MGDTILDPMGSDPEDFAVPKFLGVVAKCSRRLVEARGIDPLGDDVDVRTTASPHTPLTHRPDS